MLDTAAPINNIGTVADETATDTTTAIPPMVGFDLYRDIHKAIRNELFAVTSTAGSIDPTDNEARRQHAAHVQALAELLGHHAEHEDSNLDAVITGIAPHLQQDIATTHDVLEVRIRSIADLANVALAHHDARAATHALYLELADFTADYLRHQDTEERVVMRVLDSHLQLDELLGLHAQILASVAPDVLGRCIELMLPAINVIDRTEMLAGMRATAPAEVFDATWALAGRVLSTREYIATASRLAAAVDPSLIA